MHACIYIIFSMQMEMLLKQFEECHITVNEKEMSKLEKISDGNGRISK